MNKSCKTVLNFRSALSVLLVNVKFGHKKAKSDAESEVGLCGWEKKESVFWMPVTFAIFEKSALGR